MKNKDYVVYWKETIRTAIEAETEEKAIAIFNELHPGILPMRIEQAKLKEHTEEYKKKYKSKSFDKSIVD